MKLNSMLIAAACVLLPPTLATAQDKDRLIEFGPGPHGPRGPHAFREHRGIPPHLAAKVGISPELQKKIQQQTFDANEQLINLRADLQRQQLELEKMLAATTPDQRAVMSQIERVSRAEAEVRKNRIGLMLKIRETLGPDLWQKLEAEMPHRRIVIKNKRKFMGSADGAFELHEDELDELP